MSAGCADLLAIAYGAVMACHGSDRVARSLPSHLRDGVHLLAIGKAAAAMAQGATRELRRRRVRLASSLIVTKDGHAAAAPPDAQVMLAGHPEPDARSAVAAERLAAHLGSLAPHDQVLALISGGGSALVAAPAAGLSPAAALQASRALLRAGLPIDSMNVVRKHIGRVTGGRLAALCPASIEALVMSDVLGDDPATIASGLFAPDPSSFAAALAIARGVAGIGAEVMTHLARGARGELPDTPKPGDACFQRVRQRIVVSHRSLRAAARVLGQRAGYRVHLLSPSGGDVSEAAARLMAELGKRRGAASRALILGGGEPTVVLPPAHGRGGRNQQLGLLVARALAGGGPARFVALASDGGDGPGDAAGACVDEATWAELERIGDPEAAIRRCDAYPMLDAAGALLRTGPTGTNVLDLHLLALG
jgi:hydroxypyruvate reductase